MSTSVFTHARAAAAIRRHLPRGWTFVERATMPNNWLGFCDWDKHEIVVLPVCNRERLYVFLHECGHVHCGHQAEIVHGAEHEFEAEQYAHKAMRGAGFAVPRQVTDDARAYVRRLVEAEVDEQHTSRVLRFAYGRDWKDYV